MIPLLGIAARVAGPMLARGAMGMMKSPMGRGAIGGFVVGKAVGRNQAANQGMTDGGMGNWFPGSQDSDGAMR